MIEKFQHLKTRNLEFTDIYKLVEPIRKMGSRDLWFDHYFIKGTLKEYAGFPADYEIKAFVEHGANLTDFTELGFQVHPSLPSIVLSPFRVSVIESIPKNNGAYSVGPYIAYAKPALSNDKLKAEKERLGKNLLVFPVHSTIGVEAVYDVNAFCREIKEVADEYDSVRICLYWKDIIIGTAEIYKRFGFEVVTAGHFYDPMFMPRLKSIIETSTMTMSNNIGNYVGYCVYLKKPHFLLKTNIDMEKISEGEELAEVVERNYYATKKWEKLKPKNEDIDLIFRLLSKNQEFITKDQYNILNKYWGFDQVKTPKQLRKLLLEIDRDSPTVIKFNPPMKANYIAIDRIIKVIFDGDIKKGTGWIELKDESDEVVSVNISIHGNVLTIKPDNPLKKGTKYTLWIHSKSLTDINKNPVAFYASNFTTAKGPAIVQSDPSHNSMGVPPYKLIRVTFDKNIEIGTGWIELKDNTGKIITIQTSIQGKVLLITPKDMLTKGAKYTLWIHSQSLTDSNNNPVPFYAINFTINK